MLGKKLSLNDVVANTARQKAEAARSRFMPRDPAVELPRKVYLDACASISEAVVDDGFRYSKSGHRLTKKSDDLTFTISFQSDRNNVGGKRVALWVFANVRSAKLKTWRASHDSPCGPRDFVAGGQIGNLVRQHSWMEWNLADVSSRKEEILDVIGTIRAIAIPYFGFFSEGESTFRRIICEDIPGLRTISAFEFLDCFCSREAAQESFSRRVLLRPNLWEKYRVEMDECRKWGITAGNLSGFAKEWACISVRYGLGDVSL